MKHPKSVVSTPEVVLSITPRGLRPLAAAAYLGCTPFAIEQAWRDGSLKFRVLGGPAGQRVSTIEQLDEWFEKHPEQTGKLAARGIHVAKKAAA